MAAFAGDEHREKLRSWSLLLGEHQLGYGICRCWDLQFLVSPVSFSSMLPSPRIPEHLMQVPDLIDLALTVFFGGRWHILQTGAQMNIQENNYHCLIQANLT